METLQEFLPFAKEMLSQKSRRGVLKIYLVGSVLAFFGVMIGLVETVCQPFAAQDPLDEDPAQPAALQRRPVTPAKSQKRAEVAAAALEGDATRTKRPAIAQRRNSANRLHAS